MVTSASGQLSMPVGSQDDGYPCQWLPMPMVNCAIGTAGSRSRGSSPSSCPCGLPCHSYHWQGHSHHWHSPAPPIPPHSHLGCGCVLGRELLGTEGTSLVLDQHTLAAGHHLLPVPAPRGSTVRLHQLHQTSSTAGGGGRDKGCWNREALPALPSCSLSPCRRDLGRSQAVPRC